MSRRYVIPEMATGSTPVQNTPQPNQPFSNRPPVQQPTQSRQLLFPWANPKLLNPETLPNQIGFPPYMRSITGLLPASKQICDTCKIPLGIVLTPNLISECPVVDESQQEEIFRCEKCSAHLCPQVQVDPMGETWKCGICGYANKIKSANPNDYYPSAQKFQSRTELQSLVYDIIAPSSYKTALEDGPGFCFLIDMSYPALSIGFTQQMILSIKSSLDSLDPNTRVGLMTMSYNLTIFDLINSIEIVFPDLSDFFGKIDQENIFPRIKDCKEQLNNAIDDLLHRPINPNIEGHCYASALLLCEQTMMNIGGIILAGLVGLPKYGPHKLQTRKITDNNELPLLCLPNDGSGKIFKECAVKLNRRSISVHLFTAGNQFTDLSTIGVPSGFTCGECKYYPIFDEFARSEMHSDVFRTLTNEYYWNSSIKLHTTKGCRMIRPHSNCTIYKNNVISFPIISRDDAITFELAPTEEGIKSQNIMFQLSMVYTNNEGYQMIRVFTIDLPVSSDIKTICSSIDESSLTTMMCKRACTTLLQKGPVQAFEMIQREIQSMANQRALNFCSFYHLMHAMLSNVTFRSYHPFGVDGRMSQIIMLRSSNITNTLLYLYPRMFSFDSNALLPLTSTSFGQGTAFLIHTYNKIYIWISNSVDQSLLMNCFGCKRLEDLPISFPSDEAKTDSIEYLKLKSLISNCNELSGKYLPVEVIGQGSNRETVFSEIIIDDSTVSGSNLSLWIQNMVLFVQ